MDIWERIWKEFSQGEDFKCNRAIELERLQECFGEDLSETIIEAFFEDKEGQRDLVLENLQTHDSKQLAQKIVSKFKDYLSYAEPFTFKHKNDDHTYIYLNTRGTLSTQALLGKEEFKHLVKFFGHNISRVSGSRITLEPEWPRTESAEDLSYGGWWGYHVFVNRKIPTASGQEMTILDSIEKSGLRAKQQKGGRYYPARVYAFRYDTSEAEALRDLRADIQEINITPKVMQEYAVYVVKFRAPSGIIWYRDTVMDGPAYFTYNNIPRSCFKYISRLT